MAGKPKSWSCSWCGCKARKPDQKTCPRGPVCSKEEANHEALMERIREEGKK